MVFDAAVARLVADIAASVVRYALTPSAPSYDRSRVRVWLEADTGPVLEIVVQSAHVGAKVFASAHELAFSYRLRGPSREELPSILDTLRDVVLTPRPQLAETLREHAIDWGLLERMQLPWLVSEGLKPAAVLNCEPSQVDRLVAQFGARAALGSQPFTESGAGKVTPGGSKRFVYIAQRPEDATRLRDVDEALIFPPHASGARLVTLRTEQGRLLGFPPCCVDAYAQGHPNEAERDEYYVAWDWMGWKRTPAHPFVNHLAARFHGLAFFQHIPCSPRCERTIVLTRAALGTIGCDRTERAVRELLSASFVLWSNGDFLPFRYLRNGWFSVRAERLGELAYQTTLVSSHAKKWIQTRSQFEAGHPNRLRIHRGGLLVDGQPVGPSSDHACGSRIWRVHGHPR